MYPSIHLMSTAVPGTVPGVSNTAPAFINPQAQAQGQGGQFVYVPRRGDACCDQVIGQNRLIDEFNRVLSAPAAVPCGCKGGFGACQPTENKVGALYDAMLKYYTNNAQEAPEEETVEDRLTPLEASVGGHPDRPDGGHQLAGGHRREPDHHQRQPRGHRRPPGRPRGPPA
ncbi:MAG: hypothetical protein R3F60_14870 [bacterium]